MNLVIEEEFRLAQITPDADTINLQAIESIDAFGVVTLLSSVSFKTEAQYDRCASYQAAPTSNNGYPTSISFRK